MDDGVLLGMHGAHAVLGDAVVLMKNFLHQVANFVAMRQSPGGADIARHEDLLVACDHAAAAPAVAGGALRHRRRRRGRMDRKWR